MLVASDIERARAALYAIPSDIQRDEWVKVAMGAYAAGLDFETFNDWSAQAGSYDPVAARDLWKSIKPGRGIGAGTLYHMADQYGYQGKEADVGPRKRAKITRRPVSKPVLVASAADVWVRCEPATDEHPYVKAKAAVGVPLGGLRVVPHEDSLRIAGHSMTGALVVPVLRADGTHSSLQFIPTLETQANLKIEGKPGKLNLPGTKLEGWFTVGELVPGGVAYLCEGIGQAWACWKATGRAAVVCFGWGRVKSVGQALRKQDPGARLVLVPDLGKEADAVKIARDVRATVACMPEGWDRNTDVNDLMQTEGADVVAALLESANEPELGPLPLDVVFADELARKYEAPDELVQGVLTAGAGSMLYGDSNSGKTFLTIDLACAVARGVPWMGRKTEKGMVLYVAAESPTSVRSRLHAYQMHHRCTVPNFAIVQAPLDLFSDDADTEALIGLVRALERQRQQKVRLIVGDTLARLSAGANENSGEHMGLVVKRFDRIRAECDAHFLLIHHSGKAAASGARGWSGIRAAMDTEIEVTDRPAGWCAEVTKQRDLSSKGERIGFNLERVDIGVTKWGEPATTCVVTPAVAPPPRSKRAAPVELAVLEFLSTKRTGIRKAEIVKHLDGRYSKGPVYRAIKSLVEAKAALVSVGMVCIAEAAK